MIDELAIQHPSQHFRRYERNLKAGIYLDMQVGKAYTPGYLAS